MGTKRRVKPVIQGQVQRQKKSLPSGKKGSLLLVFEREEPMSGEECRWIAKTDSDSFVVSQVKNGWRACRVDSAGEIRRNIRGKPIMAMGNNPANALARCCGIIQAYKTDTVEWVSLHQFYRSVHFDFDQVMRPRRLKYPKDCTNILPPVHMPQPSPTPQAPLHPTNVLPQYETHNSEKPISPKEDPIPPTDLIPDKCKHNLDVEKCRECASWGFSYEMRQSD